MHSYLETIGFSEIKWKRQMDHIVSEVLESYDEKITAHTENGHLFTEFYKYYGTGYGIAVCGEYDENDEFQMEYYFPFYRGSNISVQESVSVERHAGKESFAGACEDARIGVTIIFYLQNAGEYMKHLYQGILPEQKYALSLSGLAKKGSILLPISKNIQQLNREKETVRNHNRLVTAARDGDEEAMDSLTIEDIDIYSMISKRIKTEDVYSIVDSCYMPYGIECDQYHIVGEIITCSEEKNKSTGEIVYELELLCNDIKMDICVNKKDLLGEPEKGRRFKGIVWMQGYINF